MTKMTKIELINFLIENSSFLTSYNCTEVFNKFYVYQVLRNMDLNKTLTFSSQSTYLIPIVNLGLLEHVDYILDDKQTMYEEFKSFLKKYNQFETYKITHKKFHVLVREAKHLKIIIETGFINNEDLKIMHEINFIEARKAFYQFSLNSVEDSVAKDLYKKGVYCLGKQIEELQSDLIEFENNRIIEQSTSSEIIEQSSTSSDLIELENNEIIEQSTSSDLIAQNIEPITNASSSSNVFPACGVSIHHSIPVNIPINNNPPLAPVENSGSSISNAPNVSPSTTSSINTNYGAIAILVVWYGISFLVN